MPLPTNAEQEAIARRLSEHRGVTVQGPPGTGKTHTIANLVSHLVGHGKRVLVTSQKEQALSVLRERSLRRSGPFSRCSVGARLRRSRSLTSPYKPFTSKPSASTGPMPAPGSPNSRFYWTGVDARLGN